MSYDWKQLGAKIAKVGATYLATGGVAALGGAALPGILVATLSGAAIAQGLGEISEGIISGISPKEPGVFVRLKKCVKDCVTEQLSQAGCPKPKREIIKEEIFEALFSNNLTILMSSMETPSKTITVVQKIFDRHLLGKKSIDSAEFTDNLFTSINSCIDDNHEFTTLFYIKNIDSVVSEANIDIKQILSLLRAMLEKPQESHNPAKKMNEKDLNNANFLFEFEINSEGQAAAISRKTQDSLRQWFYDFAREDLSFCSDDALINTFDVVICDERQTQAEKQAIEVESKLQRNETLTVQEQYLLTELKKATNRLKVVNLIKVEAIRFYLSDRIGFGFFNTREYFQLFEIIRSILDFSYGELMDLNQPGKVIIDVYLNSNGLNKQSEEFIALISEEHLIERFGGSSVYDLYKQSFLDLGKYRKEIAADYYLFLAELKMKMDFDFSKDKRALNAMNFWIGLH